MIEWEEDVYSDTMKSSLVKKSTFEKLAEFLLESKVLVVWIIEVYIYT